jgi:hypothetical protein
MVNSFEILTQIILAYFQIVMIVIGIIFFLLGGGLFLSVVQNKRKNRHWFHATVTAIREGEGLANPDTRARSKIYYPVFEGVGRDGNMHQYECQSNTTDINKFIIGTRYQVVLDDGQENFVSIKGDDQINFFIGTFLCAVGAVMFALPVIFIPFSKLTFVVWFFTAVFMVFKFSKYIKPKAFRETVALFKARRAKEKLQSHQVLPLVSKFYIKSTNENFERMGVNVSKFFLLIGFVMICLGGIGYNGQLEFIDNAKFESVGPCDLELGEDCRRPILLQDPLSMIPIEFRPFMDGIYKSKFDPNKMIVSYGRWTPLPYFILMGLGALTLSGNIRRLKKSTEKKR